MPRPADNTFFPSLDPEALYEVTGGQAPTPNKEEVAMMLADFHGSLKDLVKGKQHNNSDITQLLPALFQNGVKQD